MEEPWGMKLGQGSGLALHAGAHDAFELVVQEIKNRSSRGCSHRASSIKLKGFEQRQHADHVNTAQKQYLIMNNWRVLSVCFIILKPWLLFVCARKIVMKESRLDY